MVEGRKGEIEGQRSKEVGNRGVGERRKGEREGQRRKRGREQRSEGGENGGD